MGQENEIRAEATEDFPWVTWKAPWKSQHSSEKGKGSFWKAPMTGAKVTVPGFCFLGTMRVAQNQTPESGWVWCSVKNIGFRNLADPGTIPGLAFPQMVLPSSLQTPNSRSLICKEAVINFSLTDCLWGLSCALGCT